VLLWAAWRWARRDTSRTMTCDELLHNAPTLLVCRVDLGKGRRIAQNVSSRQRRATCTFSWSALDPRCGALLRSTPLPVGLPAPREASPPRRTLVRPSRLRFLPSAHPFAAGTHLPVGGNLAAVCSSGAGRRCERLPRLARHPTSWRVGNRPLRARHVRALLHPCRGPLRWLVRAHQCCFFRDRSAPRPAPPHRQTNRALYAPTRPQ